MKYFILVRILDIATTLWGVNHGQRELNPFNRGLLQNQLWFVLCQIAFIGIVWGFYKFRLVRVAVSIFTWINLLVVIMNMILILLVLFNV